MIYKIILFPFLLSSCLNIAFAFGDEITGHESVELKTVDAYLLNGSHDNNVEHKNMCLQKHGWVIGNHSLEINYKIGQRTGMQSATVRFLDANVALQPMGLANSYSFLTQKGVPEQLKSYEVRQIYFRLSRSNLELQKVAVSYENSNLDYQCIAEYNV